MVRGRFLVYTCGGGFTTLEDITETTLRGLYLGEGFTDSEIATRFNTYQVKVSRLRVKWGIPTRTKSSRLNLPPLTTHQQQVLVGSLLGDGGLSPTGSRTARFSETHGAKQEGYLRWKAQLLEPYTSSIIPVVKRDGVKVHHGWRLTTHGCEQLRPLWEHFYPGGVKGFPSDLSALMNPLVLAIWYMDDGGLTSKFHPRITFGLDERSLTRGLAALRRLGFKPEVQEGSAYTFHFPGQADKFFNMVRPHIPPCMGQKLPQPSARREADKRARLLTHQRARDLYVGGMAVVDIARTYGVGQSTVRRRLSSEGFKPMGRPRRAYSRLAADAALGNYDPTEWSAEGKPQWVGEVLSILRRTEFPYDPVPTQEHLGKLFLKMKSSPMRLEEAFIVPRSNRGTVECKGFFPNRYQAVSKKKMSAYEAWHDDKKLKAAIRFQFRHGDPVVMKRVLWAVCLEQRTPSVFRPMTAKFIYEHFCSPGDRVWDPCAGYGGRLLGALAAGVRYVGTDVEPETVEGNLELAKTLGMSDLVEVVESPAEVFDPGSVDLVFTSPPYFDRERYSGRAAQSWKIGGLDAWMDGFMRPVVERAHEVLSDGPLVLNIADLRERGKVIPLVERTIQVAVESGFVLAETLKMPLAVVNRKQGAFEPVLVFRKA